MLNFTVGPVMIDQDILDEASKQLPYFRTEEFSEIMFDNEKLVKEFVNADADYRVIFNTTSSTGSMEAAIINSFVSTDKILLINGGRFAERFAEIMKLYNLNYNEIKLNPGEALRAEKLDEYRNLGYTALVVNVHETSTGVRYDLDMLAKFVQEEGLYFVVDAVSSFLADPIDVQTHCIDVMITGSQKALACPPGISIMVLSKEAVKRAIDINPKCLYLNLKRALDYANRGQTPFTPAVGTLLQINKRLNNIKVNGGAESEINHVRSIALDFREKIKDLPLEIVSESLSNACTPLHPLNANARDIFDILKNEYGIWVCPNAGELSSKVFRVGHMGALSFKDNDILVASLKDLKKRNLI